MEASFEGSDGDDKQIPRQGRQVRELHLVHAALFLLVYLVSLMGNLIVPTVLLAIPFPDSEMFVLTVMFYYRYMAICRPLGYEVVMDRGICVKMVVTSWLSGGLLGVLFSTGVSFLPFCESHEVQQYFGDIHSLLKTSCSEQHMAEYINIAMGTSSGFFSFGFIVISYIHIFLPVLKMLPSDGRSKAFSTCLPHLVVFTLFITTGTFAYLTSPSASPSTLELLVSTFYTVRLGKSI
ncbi:olfactory receptor 14A2-like [Tachyglossus aculeatus]|uniref:olfactory receptor 14A2-like n=1 Tax=Tachyglossus aculeatus TaxID=9261 RepID=UPI0018F306D0|nr:olfactory receptor 14A2-like [Tachyglossus aculeatus]